MDWNFTDSGVNDTNWGQTMFCNLATDSTITDTNSITLTYNEYSDWLPYKWKKYIPTWHLVRSYSPDHDDLTNKEIIDILEGRGYFR